MIDKPYQRKGSTSNTQVGIDFEIKAREYFNKLGLHLTPKYAVEIGISGRKFHNFDLGNGQEKILVECKAHTWTEGKNVPSAKMTEWNEAIFLFHVAPDGYRKILFVQKDFSAKRNETLAEYYVHTYSHLIPADIEIWEFEEKDLTGKRIK
ncbi:hypothetical protein [Dehalococcoides mccartyi]|uniref:hypothetical protein n=1 Tax=Dehalococcoides mccartyi TaxID=61435 RepID=UPI0006BC23F3|nr:hypothetical protein [Dehalococcoides mccartyi]BAS31231.1 hypothetical protein IBK_0156 [Dehalococcoides mccartyi IBARAKI]